MQLLLLHQLPHAIQTLACFARRPFFACEKTKTKGYQKQRIMREAHQALRFSQLV